jgi:hypothetical protein
MSIRQDNEHFATPEELREQLADTEQKLIDNNIYFASNIPEWVQDSANHEKIFLVLTSLPSAFVEEQALQDLLATALTSLPSELLEKYLAHMSGATPSEQKAVINLLRSLDGKYANELESFLKVELSKMHSDGYKGNLLDGHSLDAIKGEVKPQSEQTFSKAKPIQEPTGNERLEHLKQRFDAQSSEAYQKFVLTSAYHFETFMQALAAEKGLEGAWVDEFPSIAKGFQRFRSGTRSQELSESLHSIFVDACTKGSFEIFRYCQTQQN